MMIRNIFFTFPLAAILISCAAYRADHPVRSCLSSTKLSADVNPAEAILQQIVKEGAPGVVLSVFGPDGWYEASAGYARIEDKVAMASCHLQYLQSVSKTFMAVAVLQLAESSVIDLDAPITDYLEPHVAADIPGAARVTVRTLLNHTSGLPEYNYAPGYISVLLQQPDHRFDPLDYLRYIRKKPMDFEPGTKYAYRNTNYVVLALIVDHLTGDHARYISENIFQPLGLTQTFYRADPGYLDFPGLVNTYWDRYSNGIVENISQLQRNNVAAMVGDDGIVCSAHDAVLFLMGLMRGKLLSEKSLAAMKTWVNDAQGHPTYGLGLDYATMAGFTGYGHSGGGIGAGCQLYYFPDRDTYIFVAINLGTVTESPLHMKPMASLDRLYELLLGS